MMASVKQIVIAGIERTVSGEGHFFDHLPEGVLQDQNIDVLRQLVPRGGTVYDIGANIGLVTVGLADIAGHIIAVEPSEATFAHLRRNTAHLRNVTCVRALVGPLGRRFIENSVDPTGSTSAPTGVEFNHGHLSVVDVPTISLDALVSSHGPPDWLKIDVEGAEMEVLRSGRTALGNKPAVMLEFNALCLMAFGRANPADVIAEIRKIFPRVCRVTRNGLEHVTDDYAFLCEHILRNSSVDDLVCTFPVESPGSR